MDLLITVSNQKSTNILLPLLQACVRCKCEWEIFFTHEGTLTLNRDEITALLTKNNSTAIVCHDSWVRYAETDECPVALGSQTNHSGMIARAKRVISL